MDENLLDHFSCSCRKLKKIESALDRAFPGRFRNLHKARGVADVDRALHGQRHTWSPTVVPGRSPFDRRTGIVWAARPRLPCCPDKWVHQLVGRLEAEARTVCFLYSSSKPQVAAERRAFRQTLLAQARRLLQHKHL